jgi:hypothetical protein
VTRALKRVVCAKQTTSFDGKGKRIARLTGPV